MSHRPFDHWTRREFLTKFGLVSGAALLGFPAETIAAEPPPETTSIRLVLQRGACTNAPQYLAQEFLRQEGFIQVQYVQGSGGLQDEKLLTTGAADFITVFAGRHIFAVDTGDPIVVLAGLHPVAMNCLEPIGLFRSMILRGSA